MTTILFHKGTLYADSRAFFGDRWVSPGSKHKLHRLKNGDRIGVSSGMTGAGEKIRDFMNGTFTDRGELPNDFRMILVKGRSEFYVANGGLAFSGPIKTSFYAIGTGADYATGALHAGASPMRAMEIAIKLDPLSGGPIRVMGYQK